MRLPSPRSTRTDTFFPYPTLFRSDRGHHRGGLEIHLLRPALMASVRRRADRAVAARAGDPGPDRGLRVGLPGPRRARGGSRRSEEHPSELQSLMRISYAVFCLKTTQHVIRHTLTLQQRSKAK